MDLNAIIHVSGDTAYVYAFISDPANSGVPVDADGAISYSLYRGENGTAVTTGSMAKLDDAGTTGLYSEGISVAGLAPGVYLFYALATVGGNLAHTGKVFVVGGAGPLLVRTTIATLASQTSFTLTGGPPDNNAIRYCTIVVRDAASVDQICVGYISAYTGSTKTVTLAADPGIFTMAVGDTVEVWAPTAANMKLISEDATAADNAESFFDGTGYAGTNNVIPLVTLTTTTTTLTNAPPDSSGVTTLLSRIPSALFSGITSLAHWLGLIAGKQTPNSTAQTEIRATGAGSGTYDATTDSLEANRDNVGTAGANLTIAAVTGAVGSVTGAVGSVTGNVGGNVTGSVGSVAGAVGSVTGNVGGNVVGSVGSVTGLTASNLDATISSRATPAQVNAEADTALSDAGVTLARMGALTDWIDGGRLDLMLDATATASALSSLVSTVGAAGAGLTAIPKTGYKLASDGLDLVVPADPSTIPVLGTSNIVTWIGYFGVWSKCDVESDEDELRLKNQAGTLLATHPQSDDGTTFHSDDAA